MGPIPDHRTIHSSRRKWLAGASAWMAGQFSGHAAPAPSKGLVFAVRKAGRLIYVGGGLHRLDRGQLPMPWPYEMAFRASVAVYFEVDPREQSSRSAERRFAQAGTLPSGTRLQDMVPPATWKLLTMHCDSRGFDVEDFQNDSPWLASPRLVEEEYTRLGIESRFGMESYFGYRAKLARKRVRGLDTAEQVIDAVCGGGMEAHLASFAETLRSLPSLQGDYTKLISAWRTGDEPALLKVMRPSGTSDPDWQRMVAARNARWLPGILRTLGAAREPVFILTGLDHVPGPGGLIEGLRAAGCHASQLTGSQS